MSEVRQLLSREERRESILRAAARAFADGGYAATAMDDVAAEDGITKLIVYKHFDSKESLYRAVLQEMVERLRVEFLKTINTGERRGAIVQTMLSAARIDPDGYRLLMWHAPRERDFEEVVAAYLNEAIADMDRTIGESLPPGPLRTWRMRMLFIYTIEGVLSWLQVGDPALDDEFVGEASAGLEALYGSWTADS